MNKKKNYTYFAKRPHNQGLYDSSKEHDSCGIGFVANIKGNKEHSIILDGLKILNNLTHRGAVGADPTLGDGAGILIQIPDIFLREECEKNKITLPQAGSYAVAQVFFPNDKTLLKYCEDLFENIIEENGAKIIGWRTVPINTKSVSDALNSTAPLIKQAFIVLKNNNRDQNFFERKIFIIRKILSNKFREDKFLIKENQSIYICSFSSRTLNYKGMLLSDTVGTYFKDLEDERVVSALALVHQRFSTNTFPSWDLAQPFRMICHNGEINTLRGNVNWMNARKHIMSSEILGDDLKKIWPIISERQSDSACFDNALELLTMGGYSLSHAMMLLIPEAWKNNNLMDDKRRAFYEYNSSIMEPWDGPAAIAFTDGKQIGATLDRNGLRPARYFITDDDKIVLSSEMGVLSHPESKIKEKWRLQPGKMLLIDLEKGAIITDKELKDTLSNKFPYVSILKESNISLKDLYKPPTLVEDFSKEFKLDLQQAFGYTQEDIKFLMSPMVEDGEEATGSMGTDTPIAVLSSKHKPLYNFFKQLFAQVTNPAIDPIREKMVMSLMSILGPRKNVLSLKPINTKCLKLDQPIINDEEMAMIKNIDKTPNSGHKAFVLDATSPLNGGARGMKQALELLKSSAENAIKNGSNIIVISDRAISENRIALPSLLSTSIVHQYLVKIGLRTNVGLAVETGEAREVHHFCVLGGYGADAINPYLAFSSIKDLICNLSVSLSFDEACINYVNAIGKGILKVMSKMGISTYQSYNGAQIFDALGLSTEFVEEFFPGTSTKIEGLSLDQILVSSFECHKAAFGLSKVLQDNLEVGGDYAFRIRGENHVWAPDTIKELQHAVRGNLPEKYKSYAKLINDQSEQAMTPRGLFKLNINKTSIDITEVETAENIVKRFATGAMSFGSISREAHTTLALAMNKIGGKSNTGEGGEEVDRFIKNADGSSMRSAIKQVASGRFGVTAEYLVNADDIQIKIAQGAKPGEGGQLPGHKVDSVIAKVRHSTPGVGLISPAPHHDIYSIEDLAQLIFDLKNVNSAARISVKLVSEIGVGTVAAGVSKARADHITIAGFEGGTGASPQTSIKHAGSPWEIGLAETQQTLVLNGLRGRTSLQVDGGLRTGRDVVIGALLGADEFGFSTAPLIASGCIMMRKCHLNTCPVGIATQNPDLRKKFSGTPEHVINYFFFVAEEVRYLMADLGFKTFNEMIGKVEKLDTNFALDHWKTKNLDFSKLFYKPDVSKKIALYNCEKQDHPIQNILDRKLIPLFDRYIKEGNRQEINIDIKNTDRTTGAMLSGKIALKKGHVGLIEDAIKVNFTGTAGQSFGAFLASGITFNLSGEANDYVGKGLSGGKIIIRLIKESKIISEESMIIGNTVLYGAISGECYFNGNAGERFCVRNSGAIAVVEGVGDHGCEYMTGGIVVCIGTVGRNFAAGMSGGVAYLYDPKNEINNYLNSEMVKVENLDIRNKNTKKPDSESFFSVSDDILVDDDLRIKYLLDKHIEYTNSNLAKKIVENWSNTLKSFKKIMPVDYKKVLLDNKNNNLQSKKVA
jgi:glutamate synthase (NADPH/NADH) large chain